MVEPSPEWEHILDECLDGMITHGWTVDDCLARYPSHRDALAPLLQLAANLRQVGQEVVPPPRFAARAVMRLQARLVFSTRQPTKPIRAVPDAGRFWARILTPALFKPVVIAAAALVLSLALTGFAYAADQALPGEALYSFDRALERLSLALSLDAETRLKLQLALAAERLQEAEQLAASGNMAGFSQALQDYAELVSTIGTFAEPSLNYLRDMTLAYYQQQLERLRSAVPPDAQSAIDEAFDASHRKPRTRDNLPLGLEVDPSPLPATPASGLTVPPVSTETPTLPTPTANSLEAPGSSGNTPGGDQAGDNTGNWRDAPGQTGSNPGQTGAPPPGQTKDDDPAPDVPPVETPVATPVAPGHSGDAPGSPPSGDNPGSWNQAPGQTGANPGLTDALPPGQVGESEPTDPSDGSLAPTSGAPGNSGNTPASEHSAGNPSQTGDGSDESPDEPPGKSGSSPDQHPANPPAQSGSNSGGGQGHTE